MKKIILPDRLMVGLRFLVPPIEVRVLVGQQNKASSKRYMKLFSERNNIRNAMVGPEEMPEALKNRIWNILSESIESDEYYRNDLIKKAWSDFYKNDTSDLHGITSYR